MSDPRFNKFIQAIDSSVIPDKLNDPFDATTLEICKMASDELQLFLLSNDSNWIHNFGINPDKGGSAKGKMVGILVVTNQELELGYLCAFSGRLADENLHERFVPSVFDASTDNYFINRGMAELTHLSTQINELRCAEEADDLDRLEELKNFRKFKSANLQEQLFEHYHFLNRSGESKNVITIFEEFSDRKPPSAAGECSAPKLLNYAFAQHMKPIAIAEFWWGKSPESNQRIHKAFYPACQDKCLPILSFMLGEAE